MKKIFRNYKRFVSSLLIGAISIGLIKGDYWWQDHRVWLAVYLVVFSAITSLIQLIVYTGKNDRSFYEKYSKLLIFLTVFIFILAIWGPFI